MSKYKVGDVVKMRDDLTELGVYNGITYLGVMYREYVRIREDMDDGVYRVSEPDGLVTTDFLYSDPMFEGLAPEPKSETTYMRYDDELDVVYIRIGSMTLCVPQRAPMGIARKNPKDEECQEIGEALAYQRMILQSTAKEDK